MAVDLSALTSMLTGGGAIGALAKMARPGGGGERERGVEVEEAQTEGGGEPADDDVAASTPGGDGPTDAVALSGGSGGKPADPDIMGCINKVMSAVQQLSGAATGAITAKARRYNVKARGPKGRARRGGKR